MTWSPIENTGFKLVIGSWNTIPIPGPRTRRSPASLIPVSTLPSNTTRPAATRATRSGNNPMTLSAVTLFPLPLSPTTPSTSPGATERQTSSTAVTSPRPVRNATVSPSISSRLKAARAAAGPARPAARPPPG